MKKELATILAMTAALGVGMPGLGGSSRRELHRPFTDDDQDRIDAAEEKRTRKAAKRIADQRSGDTKGSVR